MFKVNDLQWCILYTQCSQPCRSEPQISWSGWQVGQYQYSTHCITTRQCKQKHRVRLFGSADLIDVKSNGLPVNKWYYISWTITCKYTSISPSVYILEYDIFNQKLCCMTLLPPILYLKYINGQSLGKIKS